MAIWSLTQERVEKLLKQIGEKEEEIDALIKLSPKDIWNVDLDAFVEEWNTQLDEETKRKKKVAGITRRASHKLGLAKGKGKKKRKMDDSASDDSDDDFGPAKKKTKPKKEGLLSYLQQDTQPVKKPSAAEALKTSTAFNSAAPQKQGTLLSHLVKKEATPQTDVASDEMPGTSDSTAPKRGRPAAAKPAKKPLKVIESDEDDESDVFAAVAQEASKKPQTTSRAARSVAKVVPKYTAGDDSDSDDDDMLGDVSLMVKGIGGGSNGAPMFKTSRPVSNGSVRAGSGALGSKARKASNVEISDDDTTNYEGLAQSSPQRPPPRSVNDTLGSESDEFDIAPKKPVASKLTARPAPKLKAPVTKPAAKAKSTSAAAPPKKSTVLSPAAKAYAKKVAERGMVAPSRAKKPAPIDSDDDMEDDADAIVDDLLSDEDEEPTPKPTRAPAARPGRRAAASKKPSKYTDSSSGLESSGESSEESFEEGFEEVDTE